MHAQPLAAPRPRACGRLSRWRQIVLVVVGLGLPAATGLAHGALDEKIAQLKTAIEAKPDDLGLQFALANIYCQHEEWAETLALLDGLEQAAPGQYDGDFLRGEALLGLHRPAAAKPALDRFIVTHPQHARALRIRARTRAALGESAGALIDYRAALGVVGRPEADFVQEAAAAFATLGQRDEAIDVLSRGIEQLGDIPSLVAQVLELEVAAKRFDAALGRVEVLQKSAPRPEPWRARRAALLAQAGRTEEARLAWQELVDHLGALPNLERGSPAMTKLAAEAKQALRALPEPATAAAL